MKKLNNVKSFNQFNENLNISDVSDSNLKTIQIDLSSSNISIRKEVMDKLYNLGYKWNNGYLSIDVGIRNKFWNKKDVNYISDRNYIIVGPFKQLEKNQIGHTEVPFSDLDIITPQYFLDYYS